jgi:hypothetical protein
MDFSKCRVKRQGNYKVMEKEVKEKCLNETTDATDFPVFGVGQRHPTGLLHFVKAHQGDAC